MKPYGVKRDWNAVEDETRNGKPYRAETFAKTRRAARRRARRRNKQVARSYRYTEGD